MTFLALFTCFTCTSRTQRTSISSNTYITFFTFGTSTSRTQGTSISSNPDITIYAFFSSLSFYTSLALFSLFSFFTVMVMLIAGGLILYSLWFLIAATSIWFVKTWNATEVLRALLASGRYPLNAYPPALRLLFTLVLPVLFFAAARAFWLFALRFYTSASS